MNPEDRALLNACLSGSPQDWDRLIRRHGPAMRRAVRIRLKAVLPGASDADADDVLQRVFLELQRDSARLLGLHDGRAGLAHWLCFLALREAASYARSERRSPPPAALAREDAVPEALSQLIRMEDRDRIRQALRELPAREALLLRLIYWDEASYAEAARILGLSEGSISPLLGRARDALGRKMGNPRTDPASPGD